MQPSPPSAAPIQALVLERLRGSFRRIPLVTTALVAGITLIHFTVGLDDWLMGRALFDDHQAGLYDIIFGAVCASQLWRHSRRPA